MSTEHGSTNMTPYFLSMPTFSMWRDWATPDLRLETVGYLARVTLTAESGDGTETVTPEAICGDDTETAARITADLHRAGLLHLFVDRTAPRDTPDPDRRPLP